MEIEVKIKNCVGNLIRFEYYNDGSRTLLDNPYRPKGKNAHFRLPTGKKKVEYFSDELSDEDVLKAVSKKYSNFKFKLHEKPISGCGVCGSKMVLIRGKFPKDPNREICPCCAQERLEYMQDITSNIKTKSHKGE